MRRFGVAHRKALLAVVLAASLLASLPASSSARRSCGTIHVRGGNLPVRITAGSTSCKTAHRVLLGAVGIGRRSHVWSCTDALGDALTRLHQVETCAFKGTVIRAYEPGH